MIGSPSTPFKAKALAYKPFPPTIRFGDDSTDQKAPAKPIPADIMAPNRAPKPSQDAAKEKTSSEAKEPAEAVHPRTESPADRLSLPTKAVQREILSDDDIKNQKRYPGRNATLTVPIPFNQTGKNALGTLKALGLWVRGVPAQDYQLSSLSNTTTMGGSAMIAILATMGMRGNPNKAKGAIEFVPEFLGVVSWFAAMALTPKIIDAFVNLKTGVNLQQNYDSSYGERKKLYTDPHYVPMYLLSDKTINRIAKHLGIPEDAPDRHDQIEDRIRQVSVQAHTWWMLVAGPAAAVLSGLTCDVLQTPVLTLANSIRKKMVHSPRKALDCIIADRPEADLSQWWKKLGSGIIKHAGLNDKNPHYEIRANKTIEQLANLAKPENAHKLKNLKEFLKAQETHLSRIETDIQALLKTAQNGGSATDVFNTMQRKAEERLANAHSTQSHYQAVLKMLEEAPSPSADLRSRLRHRMESNLPVLQGLLDHNWTLAKEIAGSEKNLQYIMKSLEEKRPGKAANAMGAAPMEHIMQSLQDSSMRIRWQTRMSKGVGGAIMASTLLYTLLFVGRDFKSKNSDDREADPSLEEEGQ